MTKIILALCTIIFLFLRAKPLFIEEAIRKLLKNLGKSLAYVNIERSWSLIERLSKLAFLP
ncbi:hypothetical protein H1Q63_02735 [Desmonostoc muscorum CCALA 125]|nr:hypothetical protein [Desmonostoc muscorum CCALA 125]